MQPTRKLSLKKETLADLSHDEMRLIAGAAAPSGHTCFHWLCGFPSNIGESMCGCFTEYCSIDVC